MYYITVNDMVLHVVSTIINPYIRNLIREVLFIPRLMLRLLPFWLGSKFHLDHFHRPSRMRFLL